MQLTATVFTLVVGRRHLVVAVGITAGQEEVRTRSKKVITGGWLDTTSMGLKFITYFNQNHNIFLNQPNRSSGSGSGSGSSVAGLSCCVGDANS